MTNLNHEDYLKLMKRVDELWNSTNKDDSIELDKIVDLIIQYEEKHYPMVEITEEDKILFRKEQENN